MTFRRHLIALLLASAGAVHPAVTAAAITNPTPQRAYVSAASGNDANNCGQASPCRTIQAALAQVNPGGEVLVLDSGGFGSSSNNALVYISQAVTITVPPGIYGGISPPQGFDGVTINAPGAAVTLRGLSINSQASTAGSAGGNGVNVLAAASVVIDRCTINGMPVSGIGVTAAVSGLSLQVTGTVVTGSPIAVNLQPSFTVTPSAALLTAALRGVVLSGSYLPGSTSLQVGLRFGDATEVALDASTLTGFKGGVAGTAVTAPAHLVATNNVFSNPDASVVLTGSSAQVPVSADLRANLLTGAASVTTGTSYGAAVTVSGPGAAISLSDNTIAGNAVGALVGTPTGGVIYSYGNNQFQSNGTAVSGTLTVVSGQ